ncbi:MAG: YeeE/YedE family protein [Deltaproteobacteria bacterium]|nr:YeeE/YedE family protein [Deltaproteobacteria bacterium]
MEKTERPLWNPYLAGAMLGLVLLASFVVLGFGLGASGAANRAGVAAVNAVAPAAVEANDYMRPYVSAERNVLDDWLVFEVIGVFLGGAVGAYSGGRLRRGGVEKGPNISVRSRMWFALGGGLLMGMGARVARGCASGQALTGGALLSAGSWAFMMMFFAGGYLLAPLVRRQWR